MSVIIPPAFLVQSFWIARYRQRADVHEWECDWSLLPRDGLIELGLVCPNGQIGVLQKPPHYADGAGIFFQLKVATTLHGTLRHVIGRLDDPDGAATLYAWEYDTGRLVGPFVDNVAPGQCRYDIAIQRPSYDVLGVRP